MSEKDLQVVDIDDRFYWSLSQLQKAFGPARETISKRLHAADVHAVKKRGGHDVFHIADAAKAILAGELPSFSEIKDPDLLPPKERLDWFRSQNERNKYQREAGELIPESEVVLEFASIVKTCVLTLDTLPDLLEMKCSLPPEAVQLVEQECDQARSNLAKQLEK